MYIAMGHDDQNRAFDLLAALSVALLCASWPSDDEG
jgi:hypothetical protein